MYQWGYTRPRKLKIYMRERRTATKKITKTMTSTGTKRPVGPEMEDMVEAMRKYCEGDANEEEEGREEEEDNGESDVNDDPDGSKVFCTVIVIVAHALPFFQS